MQPIDQYQFVLLGQALDAVHGAHDATWGQVLWPLRKCHSRLAILLSGTPVPIKFSRDSAEALQGAIRVLEKKAEGKTDEERKQQIDFEEFWGVWTALETFKHNLAAELKGCATYFVPKRGIYDTAELIDRAELHMPQELHSTIPPLALSEFQEAGRCLAFNLPSASGFHVARAVEAMLIGYAALFGVELDPEKDGMGAYVNALEEAKKSEQELKPDPKTLRTVKDIKDFDRNPLMHPRAVLSDVQALSLFSLGHSAITAMVVEMREKGDTPKQEVLPLPEKPVGNAFRRAAGNLFSDLAEEDAPDDAA